MSGTHLKGKSRLYFPPKPDCLPQAGVRLPGQDGGQAHDDSSQALPQVLQGDQLQQLCELYLARQSTEVQVGGLVFSNPTYFSLLVL